MEWRSWWLTENLNDTSTISLGAALTCWRSEWWCHSNPGTKPKLEWDYYYNEQWQVVNLWRLTPKIINLSLPSIYWSKQPMKLFLLCHHQGCLNGPALPSIHYHHCCIISRSPWGARFTPHFCGYHRRETGSMAIQEGLKGGSWVRKGTCSQTA